MTNRFRRVVLILAMVSTFAVSNVGRAAKQHTLTIFVDEGRGELNGHVFVALSDGDKVSYYGFYSKNKLLAPLSLGGGQIRDDGTTGPTGGLHPWDVKRTYSITEAGYKFARNAIANWNKEGRPWGIQHHCGDFAETISLASGVKLDLPQHVSIVRGGRNRPALFGAYLRAHAGELNSERDKVSPHASDAQTTDPQAPTGDGARPSAGIVAYSEQAYKRLSRTHRVLFHGKETSTTYDGQTVIRYTTSSANGSYERPTYKIEYHEVLVSLKLKPGIYKCPVDGGELIVN